MKKLPLLCMLSTTILFAKQVVFHDETNEAWLTGTLLAPNGHTLPAGQTQLQPYLFGSDHGGTWNHIFLRTATPPTGTLNGVMKIGRGLLRWMDFECEIQGMVNNKDGSTSWRRGDIQAGFGFQICNDDPASWYPDFRFLVLQTFPFGFYDKLNPNRSNTGISGGGTYQTTWGFIFQKLFHPSGIHFARVKLTTAWTNPYSAYPKRFSTYGGGYEADFKVRPGSKWALILSSEYAVSRSVAFGFDLHGTYARKVRYENGYLGVDQNGNEGEVLDKKLLALSFAPCIEFNFTKDIGLVGGVWFTLLGRSSDDFFTGIISLNSRF